MQAKLFQVLRELAKEKGEFPFHIVLLSKDEVQMYSEGDMPTNYSLTAKETRTDG